MAWETGTVTNHRDLLGKLRDFLVSNATLVAANQNWSLLSGPGSGTPVATDEIVLSGPGLAGDDDIRVGFKFHENAGGGFYNLGIVGLTSSGVNDIENQPGASMPHWMLLLNSAMTYWFIGNGRCFKVIVRAGGNYQQMYGGFILPEHLPDDWPYPLYVGACAWERDIGNSESTLRNTAFWHGSAEGTSSANRSCASLCDAGRVFRRQANYYRTGNENSQASDTDQVHTQPWYLQWFENNVRQSLTNQPVLVQGSLFSNSSVSGHNFYGRFDGVFYLPAFGSTPEQIITVDTVDYLAVPNVFRTNDSNYCAYALT